MAKVLVLSPFAILPPRGGNRARIFMLIRALQHLGHEVHVAVAPRWGKPANWSLHVEEYGAENAHLLDYGRTDVVEKVRARYAQTYRWILRKLGSPRHHYRLMDERVRVGYGRALKDLHRSLQFDCVVVEFTYLSKLLQCFPSTVLKVLDTHDIFADRHLRMASEDAGYTEFSMHPSAELRALRRADVVLAIQDREAKYFRGRLGSAAKVHTVSHFIEPAEKISANASATAAFVGANSKGNLDTLMFLQHEILPRIVQEIPDFRLVVAGGISRHVPEQPSIEVLGEVDRIRDVFTRAPMLLSPTRVGTGIAIKLLDALALGVPIVTSETGARGHPHTGNGLTVVPDNDPAAFAAATIALLRDPTSRERLSEEAFAAASSWNVRQYDELLAAIPL